MTIKTTQVAWLGAQVILASDLPLPPKPTPPKPDQVVVWVDLLDVEAGGFWFKGKFFPVDEAEMDRLVSVHDEMTAEGYQPPHLIEHNKNGERRGSVVQLVKWPDPRRNSRPTLIGAVALTDPDALQKIQRGEIRYFSPGVGSVEDQRTGKIWRNAINEVSRVSAPHRKTGTHILGAEQQADTGETMEDENKPGAEAPTTESRLEAMESRCNAMEATLGEIKASLGEMKTLMEAAPGEGEGSGEDEDNPTETPESPPATLSEVTTLQAKVKALEEERDRAKFEAGFKPGVTVTLSEVNKDTLYKFSKADPEGFKRLVQGAESGKPAQPPAPKDPVPPTYNPWGDIALGEGEATDPTPKVSPKDVSKLAKDAGVTVQTMHQRLVREGRL